MGFVKRGGSDTEALLECREWTELGPEDPGRTATEDWHPIDPKVEFFICLSAWVPCRTGGKKQRGHELEMSVLALREK
jgi:hypothetical protein